MTSKDPTKRKQLLRRFGLTLAKWRSLSVLCVLTLAISLIVNACSPAPPKLTPLRVGITSWAGFDIVLYAQEVGLFKQRGLDVQLIRFENQQDSTRAMLRGNLDATFVSLWDVMQSDSGSDKPVVVMVTNISHGADGIVAQPAIKSVKDLRGKRVGAKLGTVNHLILLEALNLHRIKPEEVKVEDISNETAVDLMRQGRLDAAVIWQPLLGETAQNIQGNIIYTTKEIDSLVIDTLVSRSTIARRNNAELKQFIMAWFEMMSDVETKPQEVFEKVGKNLGQKSEVFAQDYAGLKKGDIAIQEQMFKSGRLPEAIAQMAKLLKSDPRAGRMPRQDVEINTELVTAAIKEWKL
jgi:NitT/TauT family transport system substrate-binding protein